LIGLKGLKMFKQKQKIHLPTLVKFLRENGICKYSGEGLEIEFFPQSLLKQPMVDNTLPTEAKKPDIDPLEEDFEFPKIKAK
jgi:hypothetical protein